MKTKATPRPDTSRDDFGKMVLMHMNSDATNLDGIIVRKLADLIFDPALESDHRAQMFGAASRIERVGLQLRAVAEALRGSGHEGPDCRSVAVLANDAILRK
jgi:hypothetical protein